VNDVATGQGMNSRIEEWVRPEVRAQRAYHVPDAEGMIKLDAMENPYSWPPEMMEAWTDALREVTLTALTGYL
jgi:histidinol-phosphate aminotransferase